LLDRFQDPFEYSISVSKDVVVPETQNTKAAFPQVGIADFIVCALGALTTVRFNDEHLFERHVIDDPEPEGHLPAKFNMRELA
jgi:hypothetical protein